MQKMIFVGVGGFIGACLRYMISVQLSKSFSSQIPLGTLFVNVIGGLLIGFLMELSLSTSLIPPNLRLFLTTGILGGLTTFSTFSYETVTLFSEGSYVIGAANVCLNLVLSLIGVLAGISITRTII